MAQIDKPDTIGDFPREFPDSLPKEFPGNYSEDRIPPLSSMNVSSATECTGLMYRPPQSDDELKSYEALYNLEYNEEDEGL